MLQGTRRRPVTGLRAPERLHDHDDTGKPPWSYAPGGLSAGDDQAGPGGGCLISKDRRHEAQSSARVNRVPPSGLACAQIVHVPSARSSGAGDGGDRLVNSLQDGLERRTPTKGGKARRKKRGSRQIPGRANVCSITGIIVPDDKRRWPLFMPKVIECSLDLFHWQSPLKRILIHLSVVAAVIEHGVGWPRVTRITGTESCITTPT